MPTGLKNWTVAIVSRNGPEREDRKTPDQAGREALRNADYEETAMNGRDLEKLQKICGMLGSEHDGERANAARLATGMLKNAGLSWDAVSFGAAPSPMRTSGDPVMERYWRMMLDDERARNKRLASEVDKLKRQAKTLELKLAERVTGVPVAEQRKREKAEKQAEKEDRLKRKQAESQKAAADAAANPRAEMPIDANLREEIAKALERPLPDRTREFLASVKDQRPWTFKQRVAIRKTLVWVFRDGG